MVQGLQEKFPLGDLGSYGFHAESLAMNVD